MSGRPAAGLTWGLAGLALGLFGPLFVLGGLGGLDFFWSMAASAALVTGLALALDPQLRWAAAEDLGRDRLVKVGLGLAAAGLLYGVFWVGNAAARGLFDFAAEGIEAVYALRAGASPWRVGLLIGLLIGPAEEIFWRGFLQRRLGLRHGPRAGWLVASAVYAGMHLGSHNPMLVAAAAVCGLFWGALYLRTGSLLLVAVSHAVWDLAVFLLLPFG